MGQIIVRETDDKVLNQLRETDRALRTGPPKL
jgi:hypothetical protein